MSDLSEATTRLMKATDTMNDQQRYAVLDFLKAVDEQVRVEGERISVALAQIKRERV